MLRLYILLHKNNTGSIHFWKKHNSGTPKTLLYGSSKKVDTPKVDAPITLNGTEATWQ